MHPQACDAGTIDEGVITTGGVMARRHAMRPGVRHAVPQRVRRAVPPAVMSVRELALALALVVVGAVLAAGCSSGSDSGGATSQAVSAEPVVRDRLGATSPGNAPGQELFLEQVTIAPGARLATHYHQGTQVAHVVSGELTYNIVRGSATVLRADGPEEVAGPTVVVLRAGDGVVETPDVVHYGANDGDEPVVIVLAALLADGAPMATAIDDPSAPATTGGG